ncbi:PEP-CTERM sorting domain-containing protein [Pirellulaceae bacterium SH467]
MKCFKLIASLVFAVAIQANSFGSFVSSSSNVLWQEVGVFTQSNVAVNLRNANGDMVTTRTDSLGVTSYAGASPTSGSVYATTLSGTYRAFLVAPTVNNAPFSITFSGVSVLGLVASNGWTADGGTMAVNVWGTHSYMSADLQAALGSMGFSSPATRVASLLGSGSNGVEIHQGGQGSGSLGSANPDGLNAIGSSVTGEVNAIQTGANELFMVLVQVPEPATMSLWGIGAVGLAAFRFRRKSN